MLGRDVSPVEIADIFAAEQRLRKVFPPSPPLNMEFLNQRLGAQVWLKAENLLPSGAYKYRGAMNKITSLIERYGKELRIVTASSGNHGMACALAARNLGVQANVVVPCPRPRSKRTASAHWGPIWWKSARHMTSPSSLPVNWQKKSICTTCTPPLTGILWAARGPFPWRFWTSAPK